MALIKLNGCLDNKAKYNGGAMHLSSGNLAILSNLTFKGIFLKTAHDARIQLLIVSLM